MVRVSFISTYPPQRCGIGTYTRALAQALAARDDVDVSVLSEIGDHRGLDGKVTSIPVFDRRRSWVQPLVAAAAAREADVVHIQHAWDIFGVDSRLPILCERLRERGIPSVVTLHSVYTRASGWLQRKFGIAGFHRRLGRAAGALVVHQRQGMADVLESHGVDADRIHVIAHGTERRTSGNGGRVRADLGVPSDAPVLLCFGFIHMLKNLHTPIKAMQILRERFPETRLIIAGSVQRGRWYNQAYLGYLRGLVGRYGLENHVLLLSGFVKDEVVDDLYAAADLLLLPHAQKYGSASGVAHLALASGTPVVFSDSPKFAELAESLGDRLRVERPTPSAWAERLGELLADPTGLRDLRARTLNLADETSWANVAKQTAALYKKLSR